MSHIIVAQLPSCIRLFATPLTVAHQASLSLTIFWSLPKFMSIASVRPSNCLILCCRFLCLQPFPASGFFPVSCLLASGGQSIGASASDQSFSEYSGLISFRMDWLDLLQSKGLSRVFSNTTDLKNQFFCALPTLWSSSQNHR